MILINLIILIPLYFLNFNIHFCFPIFSISLFQISFHSVLILFFCFNYFEINYTASIIIGYSIVFSNAVNFTYFFSSYSGNVKPPPYLKVTLSFLISFFACSIYSFSIFFSSNLFLKNVENVK